MILDFLSSHVVAISSLPRETAPTEKAAASRQPCVDCSCRRRVRSRTNRGSGVPAQTREVDIPMSIACFTSSDTRGLHTKGQSG